MIISHYIHLFILLVGMWSTIEFDWPWYQFVAHFSRGILSPLHEGTIVLLFQIFFCFLLFSSISHYNSQVLHQLVNSFDGSLNKIEGMSPPSPSPSPSPPLLFFSTPSLSSLSPRSRIKMLSESSPSCSMPSSLSLFITNFCFYLKESPVHVSTSLPALPPSSCAAVTCTPL